jgi:hypothetical protein
MATKVYVTSNATGTNLNVPAALTGMAFKSEWEGTMAGGTVFHMEGWANVTGAYPRPNSANVNKRVKNGADTTTQERYGIRVYFGPLVVGQTFTGGQAIEAGIMGNHGATFGFHWMTAAIRILNEAGTVSKEGQAIATSTSGIYANLNSYPATTAESHAGTRARAWPRTTPRWQETGCAANSGSITKLRLRSRSTSRRVMAMLPTSTPRTRPRCATRTSKSTTR